MSDASLPENDPGSPAASGTAGRRLARNFALYTLARLALAAVLAAIILGVARLLNVELPLLIALLFAVILSLPLSMVAFRRLRVRLNESIAEVDEKRRADKADLRARLRGEDEE
ncbi:DUF4229 domain-containing protein [Nocardia stercoris]|uniref:DUF4229 domain-containing protein n=1 Tax=Nocardia stercoris TaxID=2483361 RepID=A0A3M2L2Y5_9NOCA|nr:DUF4229 domain-containing protein [Nocardia stercoris]RMI30883.1 DUF4229 domain-containing protein [Nocardia stercoris]